MTSGLCLATISEMWDLWEDFDFSKHFPGMFFGLLTLGTTVGLMLSLSGLCTIKFVEIPKLYLNFFFTLNT